MCCIWSGKERFEILKKHKHIEQRDTKDQVREGMRKRVREERSQI
jgi:16S rRNA G966 N2-methylase RsmD